MGPLTLRHPAIVGYQWCAACNEQFAAGDYVALIPLGPGRSKPDCQKARAGKWYNACGALVHWACATGEEDI